MAIRLPAPEESVLLEIARQAPVGEEALTFEFAAQKGKAKLYAGALPLAEAPELHLVTTLGSLGRHLFLTVTDAEPEPMAQMLIDLEGYDRYVEPLQWGETVPVEHEFLLANRREAALFLRACTSSVLPDFPDLLEVGSRSLHAMLVAFLNAAEYRLKKQQGLDALLDRFEEQDRDLVTLASP